MPGWRALSVSCVRGRIGVTDRVTSALDRLTVDPSSEVLSGAGTKASLALPLSGATTVCRFTRDCAPPVCRKKIGAPICGWLEIDASRCFPRAASDDFLSPPAAGLVVFGGSDLE